MNHNLHITSQLSQPWLLMADHLHALVDRLAATSPVGHKIDGEYLHPQVEIIGPVAYVPIRGMIVKGASIWAQYFYGVYDLDLLSEQLQNIREDQSIRHVVFHIDSPGGIALGVGEVAQQIHDLTRAGKSTYGYCDGVCASAAYYFAAGVQHFYASPSALIGSISTYSAAVDSSKQWEKEGLELILYRTGELKAMGHPGKAFTDAEKAHMKERTDHIDAKFKGFVTQHRPTIAPETMNGGVWYAEQAPTGLHDGILPSIRPLLESLLLK